jgi:dTDP-4-amino-4,6-dideoxygalactose transaminase
LVLRWFGVGPGDEVILPAYTYAATANIVIHVGAKPVLVDVAHDSFQIDLHAIRNKITANTKVIMPVDIGGMPCDYEALMQLVSEDDVKKIFQPRGEQQKKLGRILVLADAAHSFGATYLGKKVGSQTDVMGFSFHAVKNLTTAEGGALTFNLPEPFDNQAVRASLNVSALHGQSKDALTKTQAGQWRYDIVEAGYKCNLTDIQAAIGLVEMERYDSETLPRRKEICNQYNRLLGGRKWFLPPVFQNEKAESCYHLYALRVQDLSEEDRDDVIRYCAEKGIALNVHFQPLPLLSFYKNLGYQMADYPNAMAQYSNEISLPVYYNLLQEDIEYIVNHLLVAIEGKMNR